MQPSYSSHQTSAAPTLELSAICTADCHERSGVRIPAWRNAAEGRAPYSQPAFEGQSWVDLRGGKLKRLGTKPTGRYKIAKKKFEPTSFECTSLKLQEVKPPLSRYTIFYWGLSIFFFFFMNIAQYVCITELYFHFYNYTLLVSCNTASILTKYIIYKIILIWKGFFIIIALWL